VLLSFH